MRSAQRVSRGGMTKHEATLHCSVSARGQRISNRRTRGAALIITLILLALLSAASVAMVMLVSSDTMINGYYRNYRGSFYAADSGINVVVQSMKNSIVANANNAVNPPLPLNGVPAAVTAAYAPYQAKYFSIGDAGSWKSQFLMIPNPDGSPVIGAASCVSKANPNDANSPGNGDLIWNCSYPYQVTVQGQSYGGEAEQITETGVIVYSSVSGTAAAANPPKFSKWGAFITNFGDCQGALVPGTMTGPFFTNGQWNFGNFSNPGYTFTDTVGQAGANVSWWKNSSCTNSPTAPNGFKAPTFQNGLQLNQNSISPPANSYSQAQAILDGKGTPPCTQPPCAPDPPPSQTQMHQELKTVKGVSYPANGNAPGGVYIPYYTNSSGLKVFGSDPATGGNGAAGGFYINGNAAITLSATTGGNGTNNPTQTYTITQGSTTTTIIVDNIAGITTVSSGGTTLSLLGVPQQLDPNTGQPIVQTDPSGLAVNPTLLYVNGEVTGLSGNVQNNVGITVASPSNVSITGDLTYLQSPVSIPADTLNTSTNAGVLGIYTTENINLYPNSSGNLTVNASLAAIGSGTSGFVTPGGAIGTWTIVGGRAEDQAHSVNISTGNTYYDRRFANNFGPPWFPMGVPQAGQGAVPSQYLGVTVTRTSWKEVSR